MEEDFHYTSFFPSAHSWYNLKEGAEGTNIIKPKKIIRTEKTFHYS